MTHRYFHIHTHIACRFQMIYIYDPSAWTPNSLFNAIIVLQSFCNLCFAIFCYAIFAILQSLLCNCCYAILAMQSLLCNLCYAIFTMQSLLCNLCYAIFAFLCFLSSDCKKHYKTFGFFEYFAENVEKPKVFLG